MRKLRALALDFCFCLPSNSFSFFLSNNRTKQQKGWMFENGEIIFSAKLSANIKQTIFNKTRRHFDLCQDTWNRAAKCRKGQIGRCLERMSSSPYFKVITRIGFKTPGITWSGEISCLFVTMEMGWQPTGGDCLDTVSYYRVGGKAKNQKRKYRHTRPNNRVTFNKCIVTGFHHFMHITECSSTNRGGINHSVWCLHAVTSHNKHAMYEAAAVTQYTVGSKCFIVEKTGVCFVRWSQLNSECLN